MIKFSPKCGIFYQNETVFMPILDAVKQYLNRRSSNTTCEYRVMTDDYIFEYVDDLCYNDVSILLIGGDTIYKFVSNRICVAPHFFVYDMSPRSINNPLNYNSEDIEIYLFEKFVFAGSYFPFIDNEGSRKMRLEVESILGNPNSIMFEDFVSMYIFIT